MAAAEAESSVTVAERLVIWPRIVAVVPVGTDTVAVDLAVGNATRVVVWGISPGIAGKTLVETSEVAAGVETLAIPVAELDTWREFAQARDRLVLVVVVVLATSVEALVIWLVTVIVEEAEEEVAEVAARVSDAARKVTLQGTALRLLNKEKEE